MKIEKQLGKSKKMCFFGKKWHENVHQISRKNESKLNECDSTVFALPFKPSQAKSDSFS